MENKNGFAPVALILIILLLGVAGYFTVQKYKHIYQHNQTDLEFKLNSGVGETASWKTYRNEKYGFEFKYPKDWSDFKDTTADSMGHYLFSGDTEIQKNSGFAFPEPEDGDVGMTVYLSSMVELTKNLKTAFPEKTKSVREGQPLSFAEVMSLWQSPATGKYLPILVGGKEAFVLQSEDVAGGDSEGSPTISKEILININTDSMLRVGFYFVLPKGRELVPLSDQILSTFKFTE